MIIDGSKVIATASINELLMIYPLQELIDVEFLLGEKLLDPKWQNLLKMEHLSRICSHVTLEADIMVNSVELPSLDSHESIMRTDRVRITAIDSQYEKVLDLSASNMVPEALIKA